MQPEDQTNRQQNIELRIRALRTLWIAMLLSILAYYAFTLFVHRSQDIKPNSTLTLILVFIAISTTLISLPIKSKLVNRAVAQQQLPLIQQGYIIAWALAEVAALLGVLDFFITSDRYYYIFFLIAACGQLLHFPRREHVVNASYRS